MDLFADQGIPVILLKGSALAAGVYSNPAHRSMCDLDFLVHRHDLDRVMALLLARGYSRFAELSDGFREALDSEVCFLPGDERGYTVEPHWHILNLPGDAGRAALDWFWSHTVAIEIDGRQARMFAPEAQVIHLAAHLVIHHQGRGLRSAYDIALLLSRHAEQMDWPLVTQVATKFGLV